MKYSIEELKQVALKYNTRIDFKKNDNSFYQFAFKHKVLHLICDHMVCGRTKHTDEDIRNTAKQFETRFEFQKKSSLYYSAKKRGQAYLDDVCSRMKVLVKKRTHKSIKEDAKKYTTRKEFETKDPNGYAYCRRHNILDEVCEHMDYQHIYYTDKKILEEFKKYKSLEEAYEKNNYLCRIASKKGLLPYIKTIVEVKSGGFKKDKKGTLYYVSINNGEAYKIGITNYTAKKRFKRCLDKITILFEKRYECGADALRAEQLVLFTFLKYKYQGKPLLTAGNTEMFNTDISKLDGFKECL